MKNIHSPAILTISIQLVIIFLTTILFLSVPRLAFSQEKQGVDTINIKLLNNLVLKGEVTKVLKMLDSVSLTRPEDKAYKRRFETRFKYNIDKTDFLANIPLTLQPIFLIYQTYWRKCLLDNSKINDSLFKRTLTNFFIKENKLNHFTELNINEGSIEDIQKAYVTQKGYFVNDFGRTGFLYELLLWKEVNPKQYSVSLIDDTVNVKVNFIKQFISLGWLGYGRLGRGPGGWATNEELFCVSNLYRDKNAESFQVSYLKHEGQHFHDYKAFPNLPGKDLEYRGKILEIYYSEKQLFDLISSFIEGGKNDITNAHPFANYCIIRDMSRILFANEYETDMEKWKKIGVEGIQDAAKLLYKKNTQCLKNGIYLS